jgi:cell division septum initiation protein DivIVA
MLFHIMVAVSSAAAVTPVEKVIQLLDGMLAKGKSEKHDEQVQFATYKQFCDDTTVEKKRSIAEAAETIEVLQADIEKHTADAAQLTKEVAEHDADISTWNGDHDAATKVRSIEKTDYDALHKDYSESVDALERAVAVLKKQAYDRKQASSLVQVAALKQLALVPADAKAAITAFLEQEPAAEGLEVSAPDAYGYEFQSHGVIDMLSKLHDKFVGERTDLEKKEMNSKHAHDMLVQDLTAQIDQSTSDREFKSATKAKKLQMKADAEGDLADTSATKAADEKYLSDLTATCEMKAADFESRQQLRAEEIEAIEKAIEILSGDAVTGNAEKYLPSSLLQAKANALAQLRADSSSRTQVRAADYLSMQAKRLNSRVLSALAARARDDPFAKVKKMIKDLIVRLMEEANEEAEHKGWCDTELSTNEQTRKEKTEAVETLHAEIDELEASIAKLTEDIASLTKAVAELDAAMATATSMRQEEKATNEVTVKDAQEAQTAVAQALTVLKEFYAKAGEATALIQKQQPAAPEIFDSPYKGLQAENGGVVGMLEVIQSDFARLEAETKAAEATAQKEYDMFMTDSKVDKESKTTDIEHKTAKKQDETQALTVKKEDLEGTQKELDAALAYFDKLKPSCVDAGVSYEDRVARRKEEIESLQEALRILNGEDIA